MSSRPTDPSPWSPRDPAHRQQPPLEPDPTGVREILASLRDPGPMPADLVQRITTSLAAEQARREQLVTEGSGSLPKDPLLEGAGTGPATVHSIGTAREQRASAWRWPLIAVAASVAVLAGAVVLGVLGVLNGGTITTASNDTASLAGAEGGDSELSADASAEAGLSAAEDSGRDSAEDAEDGAAGTGAGPETAEALVAAVPVMSTGAVLTRADLTEHVRTLVDREDWVPDALSEQLAADSPIGSADGAADCLGNALTEPSGDLAERIDVIDFVQYDGEPAGLILVRDEPEVSSGPLTAYLVPADCGRSTPRLLDDPLPLAS